MTINCAGRLVSLDKPKIMGIVNLTPDSFFAGSRSREVAEAVRAAVEMLSQGADFLDLGAYSTRPGAADISIDEEKLRLLPAVRAIAREFPDAIVSVDTFRGEVARAAVGEGAAIVNDVSAGHLDPQMMEVVAALRVPYIMMHMRGTPQTMMADTVYGDIVHEMLSYFSGRIHTARSLGISDLILDPGFGFSKTLEQNYRVMQHLPDFAIAGLPILVGVSRKSMVRSVIGTDTDGALNGTTALHMAALQNGAGILRVHDVREAVECVKIYEKLAAAD